MSRQRLNRIWCVPGSRRSVAFGKRALVVPRDRRARRPCRSRPTRASPARARRRGRSPTAGRGRRARGRATGRRAGTTRRGPRAYASSLDGSPVGGGGRLPHASSARAATRGATRASRIARCTSRESTATPDGGRHRADRAHARDALRRDGRERERVRPARRPADHGEPLRLDRAQQLLGPRAQRAVPHRRRRSGRRRAAARRAPPRSSRRDGARAGSRRRRADRRPACRPDRRRRRASADDRASRACRAPDGLRPSTRTSIAPARASPSTRHVCPAAQPPYRRCAAHRLAARAGRARPARSSRARSPPCPGFRRVRESEYENSRATTCTRPGAGASACTKLALATKSAATSSASLI